MDTYAEAGIAWWNSIDEQDRRYWMDMAQSSVPAAAYQAYLVYLADKEMGVYDATLGPDGWTVGGLPAYPSGVR